MNQIETLNRCTAHYNSNRELMMFIADTPRSPGDQDQVPQHNDESLSDYSSLPDY